MASQVSGGEGKRYSPFFNDKISQLVVTVSRRRGVTFVQHQDEVGGIRAKDKDTHVQHVTCGQHDFPLSVGMLVGGVFVQRHLGCETAFLCRHCQINHA